MRGSGLWRPWMSLCRFSSQSSCPKGDTLDKAAKSKSLAGKNVAYVGGYGRIGYACCEQLLKKGIKNLVILDLQDSLEKRRSLHCLNPDASICYIPLDLSKGKPAIEKALKATVTHLEPIDILINGSGTYADGDQEPTLTVKINLVGPILTTLAALPLMSRAEGGKGGMIVNIASVLGLEPGEFALTYTATKHGIIGFTRACAAKHNYEITGISQVAICPGVTTTELTADCKDDETYEVPPPPPHKKSSSCGLQSAEECGICMMEALEKSENGNCWIIDLGKLTQVHFHKYWEFSFR